MHNSLGQNMKNNAVSKWNTEDFKKAEGSYELEFG